MLHKKKNTHIAQSFLQSVFNNAVCCYRCGYSCQSSAVKFRCSIQREYLPSLLKMKCSFTAHNVHAVFKCHCGLTERTARDWLPIITAWWLSHVTPNTHAFSVFYYFARVGEKWGNFLSLPIFSLFFFHIGTYARMRGNHCLVSCWACDGSLMVPRTTGSLQDRNGHRRKFPKMFYYRKYMYDTFHKFGLACQMAERTNPYFWTVFHANQCYFVWRCCLKKSNFFVHGEQNSVRFNQTDNWNSGKRQKYLWALWAI